MQLKQNKHKKPRVVLLSKPRDFLKIPISPEEAFAIKQVERIVGYQFRTKGILLVALTHRSYINILKKHKGVIYSNERIEFLGDAVLETVISEFLFKNYPQYPEGVLTLIRAATVRTETLADVIKELEINNFILLGPGEVRTGGREKPYILANMFEAIVGALFLDSGIRKAQKFILSNLIPRIKNIIRTQSYKDPKTHLQEITQEYFKLTPIYEIINEEGAAHAKRYTAVVKLQDKIIGSGIGPSKQRAQENAAQNALQKINKIIKQQNVKN